MKRVKEFGVDADFTMIPPVMPFSEKLLDQFSKANENIFLCVWTPAEEKDQIPIKLIYQSPLGDIESMIVVNILLLTKTNPPADGEEEATVDSHFIPITNIDGMFTAISGKHQVHVCPVCNIRRRVENKGYGFCPNHELIAYSSAVAYSNAHRDEGILKNVPRIASKATSVMEPFLPANKLPRNLCMKCGNYFDNPMMLEKHKKECLITDKNYRIINLPKERTYLELRGSDRMKMAPLHTLMAADFECILDPIQEEKGNILFESEHKPCGYTLVMESDFPELCKHEAYFGTSAQDTIAKFCRTLIDWATKVHDFYITHYKDVVWDDGEEQEYRDAEVCYICKKPFLKSPLGRRKACDHDHMTGKYLGAACNGCNINRRPDRQKIPLFFHNGRNYDTHLLIREITKKEYDCVFDGIPQNSQKFMTFTIKKFTNQVIQEANGSERIESVRVMNDIQVLDSLLFTLAPLGKLIDVYKMKSAWDGSAETEEEHHGYWDVFPITYKWMHKLYEEIPNGDEAEPRICLYNPRVTLALRKNAYPYRWFDSFDKFSLPIASLTDLFVNNKYEAFTETVTEEFKADFERKKEVYFAVIKEYNIKTVKDYALLYVRMDGFTLLDVLMAIRKLYMGLHGFDLAQYFGLPSFSWATFVRRMEINGIRPWLFKEGEMDMVCFYMGGVRGGPSGSMLRYSRANNEHVDDYDPEKPLKYLIYEDANNLYGWAMCQYLPYRNFRWVDPELYKDLQGNTEAFLNWLKGRYSDEKLKGCWVECDIYAPPAIHDQTAYYPLAPATGTIGEEKLSAFQQEMHEKAGSKHDGKSRLLLQDLLPKRKYKCFYKNLIFYLEKGMKIIKVHRINEFDVAKVMEENIMINQREREKATNEADKTSLKQLNNSGFGKCLESEKNYCELDFVSTDDEYNKTVRDPGFKGYCFLSDCLMVAKMSHTSFTFSKPIYLGATITELAKLHMYEFYYDVLQKHFGWENVRLCMTDTDSLLVEITIPKERIEEKTADMPEGEKKWGLFNEIKEIQEKYDCPFDVSSFDPAVVEEYGIKGEHNKKIGYFKSETGSSFIKEFVGLRAKCYSYLIQDDPEYHMRCKGTPKSALELSVRHNNYLQCIWNNGMGENIRQHVDFSKIQSKEHCIYSLSTSKVSMSCNDSKRFILEDNIHTLPYGHYAIPQYRKYYENHKDLLPGETLAYLIKDIKKLPNKDFSEVEVDVSQEN